MFPGQYGHYHPEPCGFQFNRRILKLPAGQAACIKIAFKARKRYSIRGTVVGLRCPSRTRTASKPRSRSACGRTDAQRDKGWRSSAHPPMSISRLRRPKSAATSSVGGPKAERIAAASKGRILLVCRVLSPANRVPGEPSSFTARRMGRAQRNPSPAVVTMGFAYTHPSYLRPLWNGYNSPPMNRKPTRRTRDDKRSLV